MARKDRAPTPPKRVQAPKRRSTPTASSDPAQRRKLLLGLGGAALVALAIVLGVIFFGGGDESEAAVLREEGCTLKSVPALEGIHNDDPEAKPKYNTTPPTSGPHRSTPAVYGFYAEPVELMQSIHNLEHGAIVIHYGPDVPEATIEELRDFYTEDPNGLVVAPLPSLGNKLALSAWTVRDAVTDKKGRGYVATCDRFSERAFSTFIDEHRYKGPERFPEDSLVPGGT